MAAAITAFCFLLLFHCSQTPAFAATDTLASSPTEQTPPSAISAPPASPPDTPKFPAEPQVLTPDITPLFPSPKRGGADSGPPARGLPTVDSSPSPPNPDVILPDSASTGPSAAPTAGGASSLGGGLLTLTAGGGFASGLMIMLWL